MRKSTQWQQEFRARSRFGGLRSRPRTLKRRNRDNFGTHRCMRGGRRSGSTVAGAQEGTEFVRTGTKSCKICPTLRAPLSRKTLVAPSQSGSNRPSDVEGAACQIWRAGTGGARRERAEQMATQPRASVLIVNYIYR